MKIKELRLKAGKSQKEIAELLNMSQTGYSGYEIGKSEPDITTLKKLAEYYGTTVDNLIDYQTPYLLDKSQFSQTQLNIIEYMKDLPEDACRRIEAYIIGVRSAEDDKRKLIQLYKDKD